MKKVLALLFAVAAFAQTKEISLDDIFTGKFKTPATAGVQWRPDGKALTYLAANNDLWEMNPATGEKRLIVAANKMRPVAAGNAQPADLQASQRTGLGRVAPVDYFWSPGSDAILIVADGNLHLFDTASQALVGLTTGSDGVDDPKFSPDGSKIAYLRNHDIWVVDRHGKSTQLTKGGSEEVLNGEVDWVYPEELDLKTAYWWSPDSSRIAYLQLDERPVTPYPMVNLTTLTNETHTERYPKAGGKNPVARVGVVAASGGDTRWIDGASEYVPRVAWMGNALLVERMNRAQNKLELQIDAKVAITEQDKYWIDMQDAPTVLEARKQFLWISARDGFAHIYLYGADGTLVRQLTRGAFEVTEINAVDEARGVVYFTSTEKSALERHLYKVSLAGGEITRITKEHGKHSVDMSPDARYYVDEFSNATTQPRQDLYRIDATLVATINDGRNANYDAHRWSTLEFVTVKAQDGTPLFGQIIRPPDFDATKKYPVLIHCYGGPGVQTVADAWGGSQYLWHQSLASHGYVIFTLDNRGMAARGHAFATPIFHHMGATELADQLAGVAYLKSLGYIDASRIGFWGWSYGGYMSLYAMTHTSDVFKAAVAVGPVTDFHQYDTIYTERYMGLPADNAAGYDASSPITAAANLKGKLMLVHGTGDDNVHFNNTVAFMDALIANGKYADLMIYPQRGHGITDDAAQLHLFRALTQFFLNNL